MFRFLSRFLMTGQLEVISFSTACVSSVTSKLIAFEDISLRHVRSQTFRCHSNDLQS